MTGDRGFFIRWLEPANNNYGSGELLRHGRGGGIMTYNEAARVAIRYKQEHGKNKQVWLVDHATSEAHEVIITDE